jgi:hypothetical protein
MQLIEQFYAVDELRQVDTVLVYKGTLGKHVYQEARRNCVSHARFRKDGL